MWPTSSASWPPTRSVTRARRSAGVQGGRFGLQLVYADLAYIGVTDMGGGRPVVIPEPEEELAESGRGLRTVAKLATGMGIHGSPQLGHTGWADLDLRAAAAPAPQMAVLVS